MTVVGAAIKGGKALAKHLIKRKKKIKTPEGDSPAFSALGKARRELRGDRPKVKVKRKGAKAVMKEAKEGAKTASRGSKKRKVEKRVLPHIPKVRKKLEGQSASALAKNYTGKELTAMFRKLTQADEPNKKLLGRIKRARALREDLVSSLETAPDSKVPLKFRKTGGQVVKKYAKGKQIAAVPDWMKGLSDEEIGEILGSPPTQPGGVKRHTKLKKNKPHKKKKSIRTAKAGGQMSRVGLSPAEESRSGTMSEAKRKKYKHGGPIHHNTSRENRLEELGRVDSEKAYTPQGKRNLKDEKKRIVRGLKKGGQVTNGNDFVSQFYDS
tara:strand:+ start:1549 stop:2523 length:975 start_codon:yes stop_codon:yes gene_type:complete